MNGSLRDMRFPFVKYHSLGNDFIIIDYYKKDATALNELIAGKKWKAWVQSICQRNYGIGADGVLVITRQENTTTPELSMFNQDGTNGQMCLNGLRCVAQYLFDTYKLTPPFSIRMSKLDISCNFSQDRTGHPRIQLTLPAARYKGKVQVDMGREMFGGHAADVGNPHFIVFNKVSSRFVNQFGPRLERAPQFVAGTNVSFVWPRPVTSSTEEKGYQMLVHERGCGQTLACSSAGSAVLGTLHELHEIKQGEKVTLFMPGGKLTGWVNGNKTISLEATAHEVFGGITPSVDSV